MKFKVLDLKTGKEPDLEQIALQEEWAKGLIYCDMEGFAIEEDGTLILMDECGNYRYCPAGRFQIAETKLVEAEARNARLVEALRFYAEGWPLGVDWDKGDCARAALSVSDAQAVEQITLASLAGIAPDATGSLSSEEFVRQIRNAQSDVQAGALQATLELDEHIKRGDDGRVEIHINQYPADFPVLARLMKEEGTVGLNWYQVRIVFHDASAALLAAIEARTTYCMCDPDSLMNIKTGRCIKCGKSRMRVIE